MGKMVRRSLIALAMVCMASFCRAGAGEEKERPKKAVPPRTGVVEARFVDGSSMRMALRETKIELETEYGTLQIPVADIQRIEFGLRIPEETRKRIAEAIADLGSGDFRRRQAAATDLIFLKEKAYPALVRAAEGKDVEAARRAQEIVDKIRDTASPDEPLDTPLHDVIHTAHSKVAGRIKVDSLRVTTLPFGEQQAKLADMRSLQVPGTAPAGEAAAGGPVLADPGFLRVLANDVGKTLAIRVTGPQAVQAAQMGVFGSDIYTMDSSLSAAAVHAGAVRPGQTAVIRVTILGPQPGFQSTFRNGIMSHPYGPWPGFRIEQPRGGAAKKE